MFIFVIPLSVLDQSRKLTQLHLQALPIDLNNNSLKKYDEEEDLQLVDLYSCISHYQWGCWGVIMNQYNTQFDYELYTKNRFQLFESHYDMFLQDF